MNYKEKKYIKKLKSMYYYHNKKVYDSRIYFRKE